MTEIISSFMEYPLYMKILFIGFMCFLGSAMLQQGGKRAASLFMAVVLLVIILIQP